MHNNVPDILQSFQDNSDKSLNIYTKFIRRALRCVGLQVLRVSFFFILLILFTDELHNSLSSYLNLFIPRPSP